LIPIALSAGYLAALQVRGANVPECNQQTLELPIHPSASSHQSRNEDWPEITKRAEPNLSFQAIEAFITVLEKRI
jgi:hypothetical protein